MVDIITEPNVTSPATVVAPKNESKYFLRAARPICDGIGIPEIIDNVCRAANDGAAYGAKNISCKNSSE